MRQAFLEALQNDLNTSLALTQVNNVLKSKLNGATKRSLLADFDRVLSLDLLAQADALRAKQEREKDQGEPLTPELAELLRRRQEARKEKNWAESDRIRDELKERGFSVVDTPNGPKLQRI